MTYKELLEKLQNLTQEQLNQNVTMYDEKMDEFFALDDTGITDQDDVLDENHFFLILK